MENGFHCHEVLRQGSFKVKKGTINRLFFTENHRHLPIASVNDPCSYGNMAKKFRPLDGRAHFCLYRNLFMQVRDFESSVPLRSKITIDKRPF